MPIIIIPLEQNLKLADFAMLEYDLLDRQYEPFCNNRNDQIQATVVAVQKKLTLQQGKGPTELSPQCSTDATATNADCENQHQLTLRTNYFRLQQAPVRQLGNQLLSSDGSIAALLEEGAVKFAFLDRYKKMEQIVSHVVPTATLDNHGGAERVVCTARLGSWGLQAVVKTKSGVSFLFQWKDVRSTSTQHWSIVPIADVVTGVALGREIVLTDPRGSLHWARAGNLFSDPDFSSIHFDAVVWGKALLLLRIRQSSTGQDVELLLWRSASLADALEQGTWEPTPSVRTNSMRSLGLVRQAPTERHADDILIYTDPRSRSPLTAGDLGLAGAL